MATLYLQARVWAAGGDGMDEQLITKTLEQAWWEAWWESDYSWDGLARRVWQGWIVLANGQPVERPEGDLPEGARRATLQDYWRDQIGDLIASPDGAAKFTRVHLPLVWRDGTQTGKADWPDNSLDIILAAKVAAGEETSTDGDPYWPRLIGPDRRAQLEGAVLLRAIVLDESTEGHLAVQCDRTAFVRYADFASATFSGAAGFNGALFSGEATFGNFLGEATFRSATFLKDASFQSSSFSGWALFDDAVFQSDISFHSAKFSADVFLRRTKVSGVVLFDNVTIFGKFSCFASTFSGRIYFDGTAFSGEAEFDQATFGQDALFERGDVDGDVPTTFGARANFHGAVFLGEALFEFASFSAEADFAKATFHGNANFPQVLFVGDASFEGAAVAREAGFAGAKFSAAVRFDDARLSGVARFDSAVFLGATRFNRTAFLGEARFHSSNFFGAVDFDNAEFAGNVAFNGTTFSQAASFVRVKFEDASFVSTSFSGEARFQGSTFSGSSNFSNAAFGKAAIFVGSAFESRAQFDGAAFQSDALFMDSRFESEATFDRVVFERNLTFGNNAAIHRMPLFRGAFFSASVDVLSVDSVVGTLSAPNERQWRGAFDGATFQRVFNARAVDASAVSLYAGAVFDRGLLLARVDQDEEQKLHRAALRAACKATDRKIALGFLRDGALTLKLAMEKISDTEREQRFFRLELRARRKQKATHWTEKLFSGLYRIVAGYGASIGLPILWLAVSIVMSAAAYWSIENWNERSPAAAVEAGRFSLSRVFPLGTWDESNDPLRVEVASGTENKCTFRERLLAAGECRPRWAVAGSLSEGDIWVEVYRTALAILSTVQTVFAGAIYFLLALAVRRKFQIS